MQLIYHTVQTSNILPITSVCNVRCVFCSHRQNPPGVKAVAVHHLTLEVIENLIGFLDRKEKIVIGESASLIMEGEPFTHPHFFGVLDLIRKKCPETLIQLTTNGTFLDNETVIKLKKYEPLEINLSLNAGSFEMRQQLMQDKRAQIACKAPQVLAEVGVNYHGSIVAMPHITGWEELYNTIKTLSQQGAQTVRVFKPGFTRFAPPSLTIDEENINLLEEKVIQWREDLCPITLEPFVLRSLDAVISGVIFESPAHRIGLKSGDVITKINGKEPFSRVEAYSTLRQNGKYHLELKRGTQSLNRVLEVENHKSGLVFDYDLSQVKVNDIYQVLGKYQPERPLIMASELGYPILKVALEKEKGVEITPVVNKFFGGNIRCAGLLVLNDFHQAYLDYIKTNAKPDLLLLPAIAFDPWERDLTGRGLWELEEQVGCRCVVC